MMTDLKLCQLEFSAGVLALAREAAPVLETGQLNNASALGEALNRVTAGHWAIHATRGPDYGRNWSALGLSLYHALRWFIAFDLTGETPPRKELNEALQALASEASAFYASEIARLQDETGGKSDD